MTLIAYPLNACNPRHSSQHLGLHVIGALEDKQHAGKDQAGIHIGSLQSHMFMSTCKQLGLHVNPHFSDQVAMCPIPGLWKDLS